ncbi:DUF692 domain-containing protein [Undibacterium cyanobacteriorum]|uniref:DUF692 domain-containing protein n=1 Tax=Undibacterium cyanobacteriorum TaxID=3073561 RepID=A0ABY9RL83_9BURK|nr:DUF692 domain-containing protein [Undibacterium sp. 20NA77.5]WMW81978.1 DUF692 domain-containing protein [Undibacterium sp. 20NA77.5]
MNAEMKQINEVSNARLQGVGIGLRTPHYRDFLERKIKVDWLEVHSENFFASGGFDLFVLEKLAQDYPISLHGVGLALGSAQGFKESHAQRLKALVDRIQPALVSEHLCWGAINGRHLNDLLPMPLSFESLDLMAERVDFLQNILKRTVLIENVSSYLRFQDDQMCEADFLCRLSKRTGCGILLDVNNVFVNQFNHAEPASHEFEFYQQQVRSIGEIHLAGHSQVEDCLIDDHGSRVRKEVWDLYEFVCRNISPTIPTLIEWDTDIPDVEVLVVEAEKAKAIQKTCQELHHVD